MHKLFQAPILLISKGYRLARKALPRPLFIPDTGNANLLRVTKLATKRLRCLPYQQLSADVPRQSVRWYPTLLLTCWHLLSSRCESLLPRNRAAIVSWISARLVPTTPGRVVVETKLLDTISIYTSHRSSSAILQTTQTILAPRYLCVRGPITC